MNRRRLQVWSLLLLLLCASPLIAQETRVVRALSTATAIRVDGLLDEAAWTQAGVITEMLQKDPREGEPASERTQIRVVYSQNSIFFGVRCYDSEPSRILATELRRDNDFVNDDTISILLDTLHDRRSAYVFRVNPLGTQYDALITDEGRIVDINWDESWNSSARVTDDGWVLEVEIPFKALRLSGAAEQTWGLDFERIIRRKGEFTYWSNYRRGFDFNKVSQAGELLGLRDIHSELRLRIKPFVKTALTQTSGVPRSDVDSLSDIGLEDVKYRLTSNFTADFTANTDFAEADVDAQVLNLTRFPVFFPEKREFFVEGAGIFDYGPGGGAASELKLFFSRRIGLSPNRETIPILGGGKLTGKSNGWTLGLLDVQTGSFGKTPQRNFAVARVKKDIFARSNLGAMVTNRDSSTSGDPYNRAFGADANFTFFEHWNIQSFATTSYTPGKPDDHWAGRGRTTWDSDLVYLEATHLIVQRDFNPEMGWLPRRDMRKSQGRFDFKPRPRSRTVRQLFFRSGVDYFTNQSGELESRNQDFTFESLFQSGDRIFVRYSHLFDRIHTPFDIQGKVTVAPGSYAWESAWFRFTPSPNRKLSGDISLRRQWGFYGGQNTEVTWTPLWKATKNLSLAPSYQFNRVELPRSQDFTSHLINSQVNYAFNNRWLTATTLQYSSLARLAVVNFRLNYIYRPNDDFFLIFNESRTLTSGAVTGPWNRSLIAKVTHSWDF
jgi:hypothetical protein